MVIRFLNIECDCLRREAESRDEVIKVPSEQNVVFIPAVDGGAIVAEQPQIFIAQLIVGEVLQQFFQI